MAGVGEWGPGTEWPVMRRAGARGLEGNRVVGGREEGGGITSLHHHHHHQSRATNQHCHHQRDTPAANFEQPR